MKKNLLISFQEGIKGDVFEEIRERLNKNIGKVRKSPIDYLLWRLLDTIVKQYQQVLEFYRSSIEEIEVNLIDHSTALKTKEIIKIKRQLNQIRKFVIPLKDGIALVHQESNHLIQKSTLMYFRDLQDHLIQIENALSGYRDLIKDLIDLQNANQTQHMNEIMKILTIVSSVFIPLTFLVGVYGMNFDYMPELRWHFGYYLLLAIMALIGMGMWVYFKKKKWI